MEQLLLAANTSNSKAGKAKVGRKQKEVLPVDEKQKKSLEAQRYTLESSSDSQITDELNTPCYLSHLHSAFRERRSNYVASLEKEVAELKAVIDGRVPLGNDTEVELLRQQLLAVITENSLMKQSSISIDFRSTVPSSASAMVAGIDCVGCSVEKLKTLLCMGQIKNLESKVTELTSENQVLKSIVGTFQNPYLQSFINGPSVVPVNDQGRHSNGDTNMEVDSTSGSTTDSPSLNHINNYNNDDTNGTTSNNSSGRNYRSPSDFEQDLNNLFGTSNNPNNNSNSNTNSNETNNISIDSNTPITQLTATELYGPPECEFARIAWNSIPSIKGCKYVDEIINIFSAASSSVDAERIRKYRIRLLRARSKLLDQCAVMDRRKVIEIWVMFLERNKRHSEHRTLLLAHLPTLDEHDIYYASAFVNFQHTPASLRFKEALFEIPVLKQYEVEVHKLTTPSPKGKENEVYDWIVKVKKNLIAKLETIEDNTKWVLAIENQRYSRDKNIKDPVVRISIVFVWQVEAGF
ncbi:UNVERIFIED_CONTAM: hypothetical protein HDU68_003977 [Siphonaria sp. JEL0065]|nr:hypothetical protein HDU68_003977 [Siphonaria sp. JEL0065]